MKSDGELHQIIKKGIESYKQKNIEVGDKNYTLHIYQEEPRANLYEGFLFIITKDEQEVKRVKKLDPYKEGRAYCPRIIIIEDRNRKSLLIRDALKNRHIIKTIKKINKTFLNKLKKALSEPKEENFNKLFDRTDVIEEFYILYKNTREYLLKNIHGIPEEEEREEFVDNFMMQMLTLWYLQEREFFHKDKNYFITKFKELKQKKLFNGFKDYYEFLTYFFDKVKNNIDNQYYEDKVVGKVVVIGPAVFLNGEHSKVISIPDKCFYKENITDVLIKTPPKKVSDEVPLLNLFESRDWTEGNIDEFVLGAIYEKLITYMERKKLGAYYTPPQITEYICKNTIEPFLVDRVNEEFKKNFESIGQIIESNNKDMLFHIFKQLKEIKILDPAVGSAHFLADAIEVLVNIYEKVWNKAKEIGLRKGLEIITSDEKGKVKKINLLEIADEDRFKLCVKFFIILSKNIYGVDINPSALKVAKARLFLTLAKHFKVGKDKDIFIRFPNVHFNLRAGNSLIGYVEPGKEKAKGQLQLDLFVKEEEATYIKREIKKKLDNIDKEYLKRAAKDVGADGNIIKDVEKLDEILSKKKIDWRDFEEVLRTKEKLIKILIASLNSQHAKPLNELLNEITDLFNKKLDEKFAEEHEIELSDLKETKTFHWFFEFPEVFLDRGGFDVVVGNPPYGIIHSEREQKYFMTHYKSAQTIPNKQKGSLDTFSLFIERGFNILVKNGKLMYIVPIAITSSDSMTGLHRILEQNCKEIRISSYAVRPQPVFENAVVNTSILFFTKTLTPAERILCTKMYRKGKDFNLQNLLDTLQFIDVKKYKLRGRYPKISLPIETSILEKLFSHKVRIKDLLDKNGKPIYYRTTGGRYFKVITNFPTASTKEKPIFLKKKIANCVGAILSSNLFFWYYQIYSNNLDLKLYEIESFPIPLEKLMNENIKKLEKLYEDYLKDIEKNANLRRTTRYTNINSFKEYKIKKSKKFIDAIDELIGPLYSLTQEEIDFLKNYEIEFRLSDE